MNQLTQGEIDFLLDKAQEARDHSYAPYSKYSVGAALLTAALEDQPSGMSRHAGKETDPAFAAPIRGLKSSLHLRFSFFFLVVCWTAPKRNGAEMIRDKPCNLLI